MDKLESTKQNSTMEMMMHPVRRSMQPQQLFNLHMLVWWCSLEKINVKGLARKPQIFSKKHITLNWNAFHIKNELNYQIIFEIKTPMPKVSILFEEIYATKKQWEICCLYTLHCILSTVFFWNFFVETNYRIVFQIIFC